MGNTYKVVVTGPFNVGKTEFVRSLSDIPIVTTERRITDEHKVEKEETTVAMDYGHVKVEDDLFHLYGTPGQPRFEFMWEILSKEMDAFIVLLDSSSRETFLQTKQLIRAFSRFSRRRKVPYLVVANKQDKEDAVELAKITKALGLAGEVPVLPCVAHDKAQVRQVLDELRKMLA